MKKELIDYGMFATLMNHLFDCIFLEDSTMIKNAEENLRKLDVNKEWMDKYVEDSNHQFNLNNSKPTIH